MAKVVYLPERLTQPNVVLTEPEILELKQLLIKYKAADLIKPVSQHADATFPQKACIEYLFTPIFHTLKTYQGLGNIRLICSDALAIWLLRSVQIISLKQVSSEDELVSNLSSFMDNETSSFLFGYFVDFWNESGSPLSNALRDMLSKMVNFLIKSRASHQETQALFESWCVKMLANIPQSKRVLYFTIQTLSKHIDTSVILKESPLFIENSLAQMYSNAFANSVAKCVAAVLDGVYCQMSKTSKQPSVFEQDWLNIWRDPVLSSLNSSALCRNVQVYLLPLLFKIPSEPRGIYKSILKQLFDPQELAFSAERNRGKENEHHDFKASLYLGCLRIGQELQIDEEPFDGEDPIIKLDLLRKLLSHKSKNIRLTCYAILTCAVKTSRPVKPYIYDVIHELKEIYFVDDDPDSRNEFQSLTRNFILRVRDSTYAISRKLADLKKKGLDFNNAEMRCQIDAAYEFIVKLISYIKLQICPGMTYQRLNLGFKLLISLIKSGIDQSVDPKHFDKKRVDYPFSIGLYTNDFIRLLVDNIANNFDDIREFSVNVLLMAPSPLSGFSTTESMNDLFLRSVDILKNIQGKQSDSGARLLQFVFKYNMVQQRHAENKKIIDHIIDLLDENVKAATTNLTDAVSGHSVHGLYKGLSVIIENEQFSKLDQRLIEQWQARVAKVMKLIIDNWEVTREILSNEAPEGNVPEKFKKNDKTTEYGPASQIISNYAWRSVKDSSLVLKNLLAKAPNTVLSRDTILQISDLILTQLASVNHKGAFYSIYPTFEECCHRCYRKDSPDLEAEPAKWLDQNLSLIKVKSTYIIRRSAGLPFLISIILSAENRKLNMLPQVEKKDRPLFAKTFEKLLSIARKEIKEEDYKLNENIELPQVHAFNCIKQLFIEAQLSEISAFYVGVGLDLSFWAMQSPIWGIRNCAVMLFAALENKLFGSKKVGDYVIPYSARLFFSRFKGIKQILLCNFKEFLKNKDSKGKSLESIFPILTILSRLEPTMNFENDLLDFKPYLLESLDIKYHKVREMAARAVPSSIFKSEIFDEVNFLLDRVSKNQVSQNTLNGTLLAIKELIQKSEQASQTRKPVPKNLVDKALLKSSDYLLNSRCYMNANSYVDILLAVSEINGPETFNGSFVNQVGLLFIDLEATVDAGKLDGPKQLLLEKLVLFLLQYYFNAKAYNEIGDLARLAITSSSYRVQLTSLGFLSNSGHLFSKIGASVLQDIVAALWEILSQNGVWSLIKSSSLKLLQIISGAVPILSNDENQITQKLSILFQFCGSENSEDVRATGLQAIGPFVGKFIAFENKSNSAEIIERWFSLVNKYSEDENILDLRYATCISILSMLKQVLPSDPLRAPSEKQINDVASFVIAKSFFLLFVQLTDDSELIRSEIGDFFCKYFNHIPTVPIRVSDFFVSSYVKTFNKNASTVLFESYINKPTLQQSIEKYLQLGKVLFDVEKDNLYRVDFELHQQVNEMAKVAISESIMPPGQVKQIIKKVVENCHYAITFSEKQGSDGTLGWCSNEIIFANLKMVSLDIDLLSNVNVCDRETKVLFEKFLEQLKKNHIHQLVEPQMK